MGLIGGYLAGRRRDAAIIHHAELRAGVNDVYAQRKEDRREARADAREQRREMIAAVREQQKAEEKRATTVEKLRKEAAAEEAKLWSATVSEVTGGNSYPGPLWVQHHSLKMPISAVLEDGRVVSGPSAMAVLDPALNHNDQFREKAAEAVKLHRETEKKYATFLGKLRDESWWRELTIQAGLGLKYERNEAVRGGVYQDTYWRDVKGTLAPSIAGALVARDGLRLAIAPRVGDSIEAWRKALPILRTAFSAAGGDANAMSVATGKSGSIELRFHDDDPLENVDHRESVFDLDKGRSLLGVTSTGHDAWVVWSGSSGMVVGGVPGSGKTASMLPVFASLAGHAELHVFDGKASYDLDPLKHIARTYDRSAAVDAPLATLQSVFGLIEKRSTVLMRQFGHANFWNVPTADRERLGLFPIVIVLDEAQTWTNPEGMDKDEKGCVAAVTRFMRELVLKGRSSGIFTVITTQQPDVKTIPSNLRNNAGRKLSFRVSTPEQGVTILGNLPPGAPSPTDIPMSAKGRFVMEADGQGVVLGQAGYVTPDELERRLSGCQPVPDQAEVAARLLGETVAPAPSSEPVSEPAPTPEPAPPSEPGPSTPAPLDISTLTEEQRQALITALLSDPVSVPVAAATPPPPTPEQTEVPLAKPASEPVPTPAPTPTTPPINGLMGEL